MGNYEDHLLWEHYESNLEGRQQARELGRHYEAIALDAVFCSDLQRAHSTAEIAFSGRGLLIVPDARLREYDYGAVTQSPITQVEEEFTRRVREPFPNGESMLVVAQRVGAFLRDAVHEYDEKTVAVIGHRATRYGLEYWCGDVSLEEIVRAPWEWREIPIWRYELNAHDLEREILSNSSRRPRRRAAQHHPR